MKKILEVVQNKAPHEVLFNNATSEFVNTMESYLDESVLKVLLHPNRTHIFSVPWVDGSGKTQVNTGYRVQYSLAMGPYKGGIRFDPSVNLDVMKFLAFEQTFKNALTGLAMGGAKGGADFDPKGKTDAEILSFCQSFINQVYQHLGAHTDVPAGDIGVGAREVGYMYGQYKMLTQTHAGVFTGKSPVFGGALGRPEATGYGLIYITDALLKEHNDSFKNKRVIISGSGNVAIHAAYKAVEKGAKVVAMSDRTGYVYDDNGLDIASIQAHKDSKEALKTYTKSTYIYDHSIWNVPCDIALPCATQSEIDDKDMKALLINGVKIVAEGANRPLTPEAVNRIQASEAYYLPGKAANAGGVAVSGLEMSQNAQMTQFTFEEVDLKLLSIMNNIFKNISETAKDLGHSENYLLGANAFAYNKLEDAIKRQGVL